MRLVTQDPVDDDDDDCPPPHQFFVVVVCILHTATGIGSPQQRDRCAGTTRLRGHTNESRDSRKDMADENDWYERRTADFRDRKKMSKNVWEREMVRFCKLERYAVSATLAFIKVSKEPSPDKLFVSGQMYD